MKTYFVQQGDVGPIKIGRAAQVERRIRAMQTGNPVRLYLRMYLNGDWEKEHHRRFSSLQIVRDGRTAGSDWFRPAELLLSYIARFARGKKRRGCAFDTNRAKTIRKLAEFYAHVRETESPVEAAGLEGVASLTTEQILALRDQDRFPLPIKDGRWYPTEVRLWLFDNCTDTLTWCRIRELAMSRVPRLQQTEMLVDFERQKSGIFRSEREFLRFRAQHPEVAIVGL
jgi:hypothetical protein